MKLFNKGKKKKGFTLVELMVVVGIIALLLLLVVPRLAGNTERARTRTFESNYRTLASDITVALVADDAATQLQNVATKATGLAGRPQGSAYNVVVTGGTSVTFNATLGNGGGYTLTFNPQEGTTTSSGTAEGQTF